MARLILQTDLAFCTLSSLFTLSWVLNAKIDLPFVLSFCIINGTPVMN